MSIFGGGNVFFRSVAGWVSRAMPAIVGASCALAALAAAPPALATYSIVVADAQTGQTGVAVASCVGSFDLAPLLRVVPGVGAIQVQSHTSFYGQARLFELLSQGVAPERALELVADPVFDPRRALRQYAVVDFWGRGAAFTGEADGVWAGDRQGSLAAIHYSAQGNLLTGGEVLDALERGFARADACDLAERLMFALEAVASLAGRGDVRCTPRGVSADSGTLRVAGIDGSALLELGARNTGTVEPAAALRQAYDGFRAQHPCGSLLRKSVTCASGAGAKLDQGARRSPPRGLGVPIAAGVALGLALLVFLAQTARRQKGRVEPIGPIGAARAGASDR